MKNIEKRFFTMLKVYGLIHTNIQTLPGINWQIQIYHYLYIIHRVINHNCRKYDNKNGCPMNIQHLGILFGKSHQQTSEIIRNLVKWEIIYKEKPAIIQSESALYQLTNNFINNKILIINVSNTDVKFIDKIDSFEQVKIESDFTIKCFKILQSSLTVNLIGFNYLNNKYQLNKIHLPIDGGVNLETAFSALNQRFLEVESEGNFVGGYGIEKRDISLYLIYIKEFYCVRPLDKNGLRSRVYNNLTNLPRDHRKYIHFSGNPLLMTDISNSQILLSVPAIENYYKVYSGKGVKGIPADVIKFKHWTEQGIFYEEFGKLLSPTPFTKNQRIELKKYIFKWIWFGANSRSVPRVKAVFRKNFPNVLKAITLSKVVDYKQFSIGLQKFEANIMIDNVAEKMIKKIPILTLHDAIVCIDTSALQKAENLITKAFAKYNLKPKFKREDEGKLDEDITELDQEVITLRAEPVTKFMREIRPIEKKYYDDNFLATL